MRALWWGALGLLCLAGCGDDAGTGDAGGDGGTDAGRDVGPDTGNDMDGATDAGALACSSTSPGCAAACQQMYECAVRSSQRDTLAPALREYGFSEADWDDCSRCTERCEADEGAAAATVQACFEAQHAASECATVPDPTQAANAINACCADGMDSEFCQSSCLAIRHSGLELLADLVPVCDAILVNTLTEPTCVGACPTVDSASVVNVDSAGDWDLRGLALHDDGSLAVVVTFEESIDFGSGALTATETRQALAVFPADGTPRWSRLLSAGVPAIGFGRIVDFDAAGNVYVIATLEGAVDLGAGEMASLGGRDALAASYAADGTLRWSRSFGGPGDVSVTSLGVHVNGVVLAGFFDGELDAGVGTHTSAGVTDIFVVRLDTTGTPTVSRAFGGAGRDAAWDITMHSNGEYTLVGGAGSGTDLGAGPLTAVGDSDSLVARFGSDDALRWARLYGGPGFEVSTRVAADGDASVAAVFLAEGASVDLGGASITGASQAFVRFEGDGTVAWANGNPSVPYENSFGADGLRTSGDGRIELAASTSTPTANVGGGAHVRTSPTGQDMLAASYGADGTHRWSIRMGGPFHEAGSIHRRLASGESLWVGSMFDQLDYGDGVLTGDDRDLFMLRFAAD